MHTTILLLALSGFVSAETATPRWQTDYPNAKKRGAELNKPLAVFLGSGADGWQKLAREGTLSDEARNILANKYVCVHIDTGTEEGQAWARAFEISGGLGIVISDHTGRQQAFRHEGDLDDPRLLQYLERYGDPSYVVRSTESNPGEQRGAYAEPPPMLYPAPSYCPS
jgi:hypothetical protein